MQTTRYLRLFRVQVLAGSIACLAGLMPAQAIRGQDATANSASVVVLGRVEDEGGKPVADCEVAGLTYPASRSSTTDAEGSFRLQVPVARRAGLGLLARADEGRRQAWLVLPFDQEAAASSPVRLVLKQARQVAVSVVDQHGEPVAESWVAVLSHYRKLAGGSTDKAGAAAILVPADAPLQYIASGKSGVGLDYFVYRGVDEPAEDPYKLPPDHAAPVRMVLNGVRPVTVRVVDDDNRPMAGAEVRPWYFQKPRKGGDLNTPLDELRAVTNEQGVARFSIVPSDNTQDVVFWAQQQGFVALDRAKWDPQSGTDELLSILSPLVPVRGIVRTPDGKPAADVAVLARGAGYHDEHFAGSATTDADGRFEMFVYPESYYTFVPTGRQWSAPAQKFVVRRKARDNVEFTLQAARRVHGRMTREGSDAPVPQQELLLQMQDRNKARSDYDDVPESQRLPNLKDSHRVLWSNPNFVATTDDEGRFEFYVGPGRYSLHPQPGEPVEFVLTDQESIEVDVRVPAIEWVETDGHIVEQADPAKPVGGAIVEGTSLATFGPFNAVTDVQGRFRVKRRPNEMLVLAKSEDGRLAGITRIAAAETRLAMALGPTAQASGRLVDRATGNPIADRWIEYGILIGQPRGAHFLCFGDELKTNAEGEFALSNLVPGWEYVLCVGIEFDADGKVRSRRQVRTIKAERAGQTVSLGDMQLAPPERPPTVEERSAELYKPANDLASRIARAQAEARREYMRVLAILGDPATEPARRLVKLLHDDYRVHQASFDFELVGASITDARSANEAAKALGVDLSKHAAPVLVVLGAEGEARSVKGGLGSAADEATDATALREFLVQQALPRRDAEKLLADALAQARRENKRVFLQETATWCGPCRRLSRYLDNQRAIIDENYVRVKIDGERFDHGAAVMKRIRTGKPGGIPWVAILDVDGKTLGTSDGPDENYLFPVDAAAIDQFMTLLTDTAPRLTVEQLKVLRAGLESKP